jgi:hypothetical protein
MTGTNRGSRGAQNFFPPARRAQVSASGADKLALAKARRNLDGLEPFPFTPEFFGKGYSCPSVPKSPHIYRFFAVTPAL